MFDDISRKDYPNPVHPELLLLRLLSLDEWLEKILRSNLNLSSFLSMFLVKDNLVPLMRVDTSSLSWYRLLRRFCLRMSSLSWLMLNICSKSNFSFPMRVNSKITLQSSRGRLNCVNCVILRNSMKNWFQSTLLKISSLFLSHIILLWFESSPNFLDTRLSFKRWGNRSQVFSKLVTFSQTVPHLTPTVTALWKP